MKNRPVRSHSSETEFAQITVTTTTCSNMLTYQHRSAEHPAYISQ
jgi:hypothetical protein